MRIAGMECEELDNRGIVNNKYRLVINTASNAGVLREDRMDEGV